MSDFRPYLVNQEFCRNAIGTVVEATDEEKSRWRGHGSVRYDPFGVDAERYGDNIRAALIDEQVAILEAAAKDERVAVGEIPAIIEAL